MAFSALTTAEIATGKPVKNEVATKIKDNFDNHETRIAALEGSTSIRTGTMIFYGGTATPTDYLACDGTAVSRTTYAALFTAIGTAFGVGDGSTTFNVPDMRRRVPVGNGGSGTGTLANTVGSTGGAETHTLTSADVPSHTHTGTTDNESSHTHTLKYSNGGATATQRLANVAFWTVGGNGNHDNTNNTSAETTNAGSAHNHTFTTGSYGSGGAHNNMQPSLVARWCIKT